MKNWQQVLGIAVLLIFAGTVFAIIVYTESTKDYRPVITSTLVMTFLVLPALAFVLNQKIKENGKA